MALSLRSRNITWFKGQGGLRGRVVEGAAERCRDVDLSFVAL